MSKPRRQRRFRSSLEYLTTRATIEAYWRRVWGVSSPWGAGGGSIPSGRRASPHTSLRLPPLPSGFCNTFSTLMTFSVLPVYLSQARAGPQRPASMAFPPASCLWSHSAPARAPRPADPRCASPRASRRTWAPPRWTSASWRAWPSSPHRRPRWSPACWRTFSQRVRSSPWAPPSPPA